MQFVMYNPLRCFVYITLNVNCEDRDNISAISAVGFRGVPKVMSAYIYHCRGGSGTHISY